MRWSSLVLCSAITLVLVVACRSEGEPAQYQAGLTDDKQADTAGNALPPKARARLGTLRFGHVGFGGGVGALAFSQDGKMLASLGDDGSICTWDAATGQRLGRFGFLTQVGPQGLAFSPDGKTLVVGNRQLWDVPKGKALPVHPPVGYVNIQALALAPDGASIALACGPINLREMPIVAVPADKALDRLRDAPTAVLLEALEHPEPAVRAAAVQHWARWRRIIRSCSAPSSRVWPTRMMTSVTKL